MNVPKRLNDLADTRRLYATYAASRQTVLSGWAAHVFTQWVLLYREVRWHNRHGQR
jgi:hypothetical protein